MDPGFTDSIGLPRWESYVGAG